MKLPSPHTFALAATTLALAASCSTTTTIIEVVEAGPEPIAPALPRGTEPMTDESAFAFWFAGADALFNDPRDAGLRRAFALLDDRLEEFTDDDAIAGRVLDLVAALGAGPMAVRFDVTGAMPMPVTVQLELGHGDEARARALDREVARFITDAGLDYENVEAPFDTLEHRVVGDGDGARAVISLGGMETSPLGLGSLDLPAGVDATIGMKLDLGRLGPLLGMILQGDPDAEEMMGFLEGIGLFGENAMNITYAFGSADGVGHVAIRTKGYVTSMGNNGALETAPITADEIGLIPTDAVSAGIAQSDPNAMLGFLEMLREPIGGDPIDMIDAMTGVHLRRDVFDHLGTTAGWYTSDATGGGGLMSFVGFLEVTNEDDLRATLDYGLTALNDVMAMEADGRVEVRDWMHGEALCSTLTFPGWPIPLELSFAIDDGFLFLTLSPQALAQALDQRASRGPGLAANPKFRAAARGSLDDLTTLSYCDTARRAEDGYGLSTLLMSAFANGVRMPEEHAYDPGIVLPSYANLTAGGQASVTLGRIEGDDLVQIGTCDPSIAANVTAFCGSPILYLVGAGVAAAVPAFLLAGSMMAPEPYIYDEGWEFEEYDEGMHELPEDEEELLRMLESLGYLEDGPEEIIEEEHIHEEHVHGHAEEPPVTEEVIVEEPILIDDEIQDAAEEPYEFDLWGDGAEEEPLVHVPSDGSVAEASAALRADEQKENLGGGLASFFGGLASLFQSDPEPVTAFQYKVF